MYTIFKNLTIILIVRYTHVQASFLPHVDEYFMQAYGEVLWFGGRVTALTLASFGLMVCYLRSVPTVVAKF